MELLKFFKLNSHFFFIYFIFWINILQINTSVLNQNSGELNEKLYIHVIPHTHDDAGWLRTFENYYEGINTSNCVKCILNTMLKSLEENPQRTFTYAEMSFFEKWYKDQTEYNKLIIKGFIETKRLEFLGGGWVMNDEATTHYQHVIDQMRLGMQFLKNEFDYVPKTAWFLDPFGHSLTNAYLMKKLGFQNLVIVRIDYRDKENRKKNQEMEFLWKPYSSIDNGKSELLTHITWAHYSPENDLLNKFLNGNTFSSDTINRNLNNIYEHFKEVRKAYKSNNIMFLYGDDFTFSNKSAFENMENLIRLFNESEEYKDKISLFYSTPSRYFKHLNEKISKENIKLSEFVDKDFFPYADKPREYWTGYFTSRPYLKGIIRDSGNYLTQTSQFLFNFLLRRSDNIWKPKKPKNSNLNNHNFLNNKNNQINENYSDFKPNYSTFDNSQLYSLFTIFIKKLDEMRRELAIAQHHDSSTGTARNDVSDDYIKRLERGILSLSDIIKSILEYENKLIPTDSKSYKICLDSIANLNCVENVYGEKDIQNGILLVTLNPGFSGKYPYKLKVNFDLKSEFLKDSKNKISLKNLKHNGFNIYNNSKNDYSKDNEIEYDLFYDEKLKCYFIYYLLEFSEDKVYQNILLTFENSSIENENLKNKILKQDSILKYNSKENTYKIISQDENNLEIYISNNKINFFQKINNRNNIKNNNNSNHEEFLFSLTHGYFDYSPSNKNCQGAYLMATNYNSPEIYNIDYNNSYIISGKILTQVVIRFEHSSICVKIYNSNILKEKQYTYEIESILHHYEPNNQKEFILVVNSDVDNLSKEDRFKNKTEFFTDTNAMRVIKRIQDYRNNFELEAIEEKVAGNFYPINSVVYISENKNNDDKNFNNFGKSLYIFNDRSQAATSVSQGEILIDINRWSDRDDRRGLADGLYEYQSSRHDFSVFHILSVTKRFDSSYLNNYLNKKPITAIFTNYSEYFKNLIDNQKDLNLLNNNENSKNKNQYRYLEDNAGIIENLFAFGNKDCLEINYFFISEKKILVQFLNKSDPNLFSYKDCFIKFKTNPNISIVKYELNGIEKYSNKSFITDNHSNKFFFSLDNYYNDSKENKINIAQQNFETILIEFK